MNIVRAEKMKRYNITIVFEDGTASTVTQKEAADKQEALMKEINSPWHKDRIVSITIIEAKRYNENAKPAFTPRNKEQ